MNITPGVSGGAYCPHLRPNGFLLQLVNSGPSEEDPYVIHRGANGEPRFGKRSGTHRVPRARRTWKGIRLTMTMTHIRRFEKKNEPETLFDLVKEGTRIWRTHSLMTSQQTMQFPYKRFGRRRMSNSLRFG